jgi:hypothetical protein
VRSGTVIPAALDRDGLGSRLAVEQAVAPEDAQDSRREYSIRVVFFKKTLDKHIGSIILQIVKTLTYSEGSWAEFGGRKRKDDSSMEFLLRQISHSYADHYPFRLWSLRLLEPGARFCVASYWGVEHEKNRD